MSKFVTHLKQLVQQNGPMSVETFIGMAIGHYYSTRDPFGAKGDFTTAPEISQMFGEMIGVFMADVWIKMGKPVPFSLVEAGPGRGTLMADLLRATKNVDGFHQAMRVHMVEISPVLKEIQRVTLKDYAVTWHDDLRSVPAEGPLFFIANELLDALPVRQYIRQGGAWYERGVGIDHDRLAFGILPQVVAISRAGEDGDVFEQSPARERFIEILAEIVTSRGGVALLIDYGHDRSATGDTLQAVKDHQFSDILGQAGESDLTSHVDFEALRRVAEKSVHVSGPVGQGQFLEALGIGLRATRLGREDDASRLTAPDQMGDLFRVMALCNSQAIVLAGFDGRHES